MPNTKSAEKALRQSKRKRQHNLFWKKRIKQVVKRVSEELETKNPNIDILKKEETLLQKVVDKATKGNVIHRNKGNRIKSKYAKQITALQRKSTKKPTSAKRGSKTSRSAGRTSKKS